MIGRWLVVLLVLVVQPALATDFHGLVSQAALEAGVPDHIAHAVIRHESRYNPRAYNRGAMGMGQILCRTAHGIGFRGHCSGLYEPATNLRWSMKYLASALRRGGAGCSGISLYQTGIHRRPHCSAYGRAVMARAGRGGEVRAGRKSRTSGLPAPVIPGFEPFVR